MIKLIDLLNEAKQTGDLYHFTPITNLISILSQRVLIPNEENQVSTSRRPNMLTRDFEDMKKNSIVRLTLDGDKISTKYKIRPFAFGADEGDAEDLGEEQIVTNGKKFPFVPYLKRIDIFLNKKPKINEKIIELLKKANIPYQIYQGTPESNIPYKQTKSDDSKDINIENIPEKRIYDADELYYFGMKIVPITVYNFAPKEHHKTIIKVGISKDYPDHYLYANWKENAKYFKYYNLDEEPINYDKIIPIPFYSDPKWRKMWKDNVIHPVSMKSFEKEVADSYFLIPKYKIKSK